MSMWCGPDNFVGVFYFQDVLLKKLFLRLVSSFLPDNFSLKY